MSRFFKNKYFISAVGGLLSGFLNGLFGSGGGTVVVPFLEAFLDQEEHTSHATAILIILAFTTVSLFFYGRGNHLDYALAIKVSLGGVAGGFLGARLLKKLSAGVIRKIFGAFMLLAAVRMVVG
ncbi:MAG: sulfite exporter TauE/SafE family protein [Ruminococcaceae bacterium]|nr:sulfite exporter TauE/SafE family protein [Oscillospiraceae bacterium]